MGTKKRLSWTEYLSLDRLPNLRDYPATGPSVGIVLTLAAVASGYIMLDTLVGLIQSFYFAVHAENFEGDAEAQSKAIRNIGLALAAITGIPFIVWRSVVAQKQVNVTEQGHITDRINKAVEGLGKFTEFKTTQKVAGGSFQTVEETKPDLVVRIGSIQALERIAEDSERDREHIVVLLTEYIRENAR